MIGVIIVMCLLLIISVFGISKDIQPPNMRPSPTTHMPILPQYGIVATTPTSKGNQNIGTIPRDMATNQQPPKRVRFSPNTEVAVFDSNSGAILKKISGKL